MACRLAIASEGIGIVATDALGAKENFGPIVYDPNAPGFFQDPYPQLEALRESDPVHCTKDGVYLLLRYQHALDYLQRTETSVMMRSLTSFDGNAEPPWQPAAESVINQDPPKHTKLRKLVLKAFTSQAVNAIRPMVSEQFEQLLGPFARGNGGDFVQEIAFPLPFRVICEMLGVPPAQHLFDVRDQCLIITKAIIDLEHREETARDARDAYAKFEVFLRDLIAWKRRNMDDRILSNLIRAEDEGAQLEEQELIDTLALIYIGGFDSVISMLGSGLMLALTHPEEAARWRADTNLDTNAIEEIIRFEPPVLFGGRRITTLELEIADVAIPKGAVVLACAGSANRDPRFWGEDAGRLNFSRKNASRSLTFGGGIHRCLGNVLARTQGEIALGAMIRRFPQMRLLSEEIVWKRGTHQRSLDSLNVALS